MKGWILFILFFPLMLAGALLEKVNETLGLVVMLLALADIAVLTIGNRRGWF